MKFNKNLKKYVADWNFVFAHVYVSKNESESDIEFATIIIFLFLLQIRRKFYCGCSIKYVISTVQAGSEKTSFASSESV